MVFRISKIHTNVDFTFSNNRCQEYFLNHIDFMKPISYNLINPFQIYKYGGYYVG